MKQHSRTPDRNKNARKGALPAEAEPDDDELKINDRRHWAGGATADDGDEPADGAHPRRPSVIDEYRQRAEDAENKLLEYIEAFKEREREQDKVRARLQRDIEGKVELKFGRLAARLLDTVDQLDLCLSHLDDSPQAATLGQGVAMVRDGFLAALQEAGVEKLIPEGEFDPNQAEALRMDPVATSEQNGRVTEVLRPGYRLGERVIRPAEVAVGRYSPGSA